jgi:ectoine hydroxylase-related dioxygenase (phytanoyl-CoA dioxygenase family)
VHSIGIREAVQDQGFAIVEGVLDEAEVSVLLRALESARHRSSLSMRGEVFAVRNLLSVLPAITELAKSLRIRQLVRSCLGEGFFPVRGLLFDKVPGANWKVPWHQDVTIAVQSKIDADGFGPWSTKAGVVHVQPPTFVLESMLTVRIHLDPCGAENGALRVVPGSHRDGRIPEESIPAMRKQLGEETCAVGRGGVLLMRPLLLHASSPSQNPGHRRVIHLDFASVQLPGKMRWEAESVAQN